MIFGGVFILEKIEIIDGIEMVIMGEENGTFEVIEGETLDREVTEVNYDNVFLENESDLIRMEMNIIEFPLFSRNRKAKKGKPIRYMFDSKKDRYLEIIPGKDKIPGEFDEKVFLGIIRLHQHQNLEQKIYTDYPTLLEEIGINYNGKNIELLKKSLSRLTQTSYIFNNVFYSNAKKAMLKNEKIETSIFSIKTITLKKAQKNSEEYLKFFRNEKIKEIVEITYLGLFYENIMLKGFLRFDSKELLKIEDSVTRNLYMMITKWRNKKLGVRLYSFFLASRIPLSWEKKNVSKTVSKLKKSLDNLKEQGKLKNYIFDRNGKLEQSFFDIFFDKTHNFDHFTDNEKIGQEDFQIEYIEEKDYIISDEKDFIIPKEHDIRGNNELRTLLNLLPEEEIDNKVKKEKWIKKIEKALQEHSYNAILDDILYSKENADNFESFFSSSIKDGHWGLGYKEKVQIKEAEKENEEQLEKERAAEKIKEEEEQKRIEEEYEKLDLLYEEKSEEEKEEIYNIALKLMEKDGHSLVNKRVLKVMFNTAYKYKAMKES